MRSTLRRDAMTTPASAHCVSCQLVFSFCAMRVLSARVSAICLSGTPLGSSGSGFSGLTGSDPAGNRPRNECLSPQTVASHLSRFLSVSCSCCTRCSLCTQLCNRSIVNLSSPSGSMHRFSSQHSNHCESCNIVTTQHGNSTHWVVAVLANPFL